MNLNSLRADAHFFVFGDRTNTVYADTDFDANINNWYEYGIACLFNVNGDWQVNGEIATTDIISGQREYIIPNDTLKINEVYIKSTATSEYVKATQRDPINVSVEPESYHPTKPEYDVLDNSFFIYIPEESITGVSAGLKIHYQSDLTELTSGSDIPNIIKPFQRLISCGAALDYCLANEMWNKARKLEERIALYKEEMEKHYATRSTAKKSVLEMEQNNYY